MFDTKTPAVTPPAAGDASPANAQGEGAAAGPLVDTSGPSSSGGCARPDEERAAGEPPAPAAPRTWRLPLTDTRPPLTLNQRMHWSHRARVSKRIHGEIAAAVKLRSVPRLDTPVVTLHYQPRDRRRRDQDNLVPTSKACVDGLRVCGVLIDDDPAHVDHRMPVIEAPVKGTGRMWLEVVSRG